jgi:hypothetical protein
MSVPSDSVSLRKPPHFFSLPAFTYLGIVDYALYSHYWLEDAFSETGLPVKRALGRSMLGKYCPLVDGPIIGTT